MLLEFEEATITGNVVAALDFDIADSLERFLEEHLDDAAAANMRGRFHCAERARAYPGVEVVRIIT